MIGYERERRVAVDAVLKASRLCEAVRSALASRETIAKEDKSPVTVADFGAQAVASAELQAAFPEDPLVAEEDADVLRSETAVHIRQKVIQHACAVLPALEEGQVLAAIDYGRHEGGATGRYWVLDPIDGTKGFLRGGQYAVALALIEDGTPVLGVLGCPNLPLEAARPEGAGGCLFIAVKSEGARMRPLEGDVERRIAVTDVADPARASFCESVESTHSSQGTAARVAEQLGVTAPPFRLDSQCKYAAVARGDASIYLRLPTRADYEEKIWDHAAGWMLVKEAGGEVTDVRGKPLDFSMGQTLRNNRGIVTTNGKLHRQVMTAVQKVLA